MPTSAHKYDYVLLSSILEYAAMLHFLLPTISEQELLGGHVKFEQIYLGQLPPDSSLWSKEEPYHGSMLKAELFGEPEAEDIEEQPGVLNVSLWLGCAVVWELFLSFSQIFAFSSNMIDLPFFIFGVSILFCLFSALFSCH